MSDSNAPRYYWSATADGPVRQKAERRWLGDAIDRVGRAAGQINLPSPKKTFDTLLKGASIGAHVLNTVKQVSHNKTMKTLHLVTAVVARISHFHALKTAFSAYDITKSLRDKVSGGEYNIVDVAKDTFGGALVSLIEHTEIRAIVKELFDLDLVPNYKPENFYDGSRGTSYVRYNYTGQDVATPTATVTKPAAVSASVSAITTSAKVGSTLTQPNSVMWDKVSDYLDNQAVRGKPNPTLKQIQSRLKGYAVTCAELRDGLRQSGNFVSDTYGTGNVSEMVVG